MEMRIAFAWYREDQWERLREISEDRDILEETHAEWLTLAQQKLLELKSAGQPIEKVEIDIDELSRWASTKGLSITASTRSQFAAQELKKRDES